MSKRSQFSPEEKERSKAIIAGISGQSPVPSPDDESALMEGSGFHPLIGILGVCVVAAVGWGAVLLFQDKPTETAEGIVPTVSATPPAPASTSNPSHLAAPPPSSPQLSPKPQASAPKATKVTPQKPLYITKTAPVQRAQTTTHTSSPHQQGGHAADHTLIAQRHAAAALKAADYKFRYEYQLGSSNVHITSVTCTNEETTQVPGWPRYRTVGKAGISYYEGKGGFERTSRGYEILTEEINGVIKVVDLTVK